MTRPRLITWAVGVAIIIAIPPRAATSETAFTNNVKLLKGSEGTRIRVLHEKDNLHALVQVVRSDSPITGDVLPCSIVDAGSGRQDYIVPLVKQSRWCILRAMGHGRYLAWLPGGVGERALRLDTKASARARPAALIAAHHAYRSAVKRGNRHDLAAQDTRTFARRLRAASQRCGRKLGGEIVGRRGKDHARIDVGARCGRYLQALETVCGDKLGREAVAKQIKRVQCNVGRKALLRVKGGTMKIVLELRRPLSRWQIARRLVHQL